MIVVRKVWWDGDQIHTQEVPLAEIYSQEKDMEIKNEITRNKDYCFVVEPHKHDELIYPWADGAENE